MSASSVIDECFIGGIIAVHYHLKPHCCATHSALDAVTTDYNVVLTPFPLHTNSDKYKPDPAGAPTVKTPFSHLLFQVFLRIEGQFNHSLQQLIGRVTRKILVDQFFGKESANIAQLERPTARRVHKISVPVVYDDHILIGVIAGSPEVPWCPLERIAREAVLGRRGFLTFG